MGCGVLRPDDPQALNSRAYALVGLGRYREALADVERAMQMDDSPWDVYVGAAALAGLGRYEESLADLQRAIAKDPVLGFEAVASAWFDPLRDHPTYGPALAELLGI